MWNRPGSRRRVRGGLEDPKFDLKIFGNLFGWLGTYVGGGREMEEGKETGLQAGGCQIKYFRLL
jgi:hypothetical protein